MRGRNATSMKISRYSAFLGGLVCGSADHLDPWADNRVTQEMRDGKWQFEVGGMAPAVNGTHQDSLIT